MLRLRAAGMIEVEHDDDSVTQVPNPTGNAPDALPELLAAWSDRHPRFADRRDAGRRVAAVLGTSDIRVRSSWASLLARCRWLRRSHALGAPLEEVSVCALLAPEDPDCVIGVAAEHHVSVIDSDAIDELRLGADELAAAVQCARHELDRQVALITPRVAGSPSRGELCCSLTTVW